MQMATMQCLTVFQALSYGGNPAMFFYLKIGPLEISMFRFAAYSLIALGSVSALGQAASSAPADLHTSAQIHEQGEKLLAEAPEGHWQGQECEARYLCRALPQCLPHARAAVVQSYTSVTVTFFIAQDGEATVLVGGNDRRSQGSG